MTVVGEPMADGELVDGSETILHSHPGGGGGGADVKSGVAAGTSASWTAVTFNTAFASAPDVVFTMIQPGSPQDLKRLYVKNVTVNGFEFWYTEKNAVALSAHWIATDAGNP